MFARTLIADGAHKNAVLLKRVQQLETWRAVASQMLDAMPEQPPPLPPSGEDETFGLQRTKDAIEKAVWEAAKLPNEERQRKLKQLRAKWHPDKHEVLKEMAEEVSKIINASIDELE